MPTTPTKRKLFHLFSAGKAVTISDPTTGESEEVWIEKLKPLEMDQALRIANAEKSKWLAKRYSDSDDRYAIRNDISEFTQTRENMVDFLTLQHLAEKHGSIAAELASKGKWAEDEYLVGITDAWNDGLKDRYATDPEDEEAKHVMDEMKAFDMEVAKEVEKERQRKNREFDDLSDSELYEMIVDDVIELESNQVWLTKLKLVQLRFAVRDSNDHRQYYFSNPDEVSLIAPEVVRVLINAYEDVSVGVTEGKSSPEAPLSSEQSEQL
jgi:hypothetical protein